MIRRQKIAIVLVVFVGIGFVFYSIYESRRKKTLEMLMRGALRNIQSWMWNTPEIREKMQEKADTNKISVQKQIEYDALWILEYGGGVVGYPYEGVIIPAKMLKQEKKRLDGKK